MCNGPSRGYHESWTLCLLRYTKMVENYAASKGKQISNGYCEWLSSIPVFIVKCLFVWELPLTSLLSQQKCFRGYRDYLQYVVVTFSTMQIQNLSRGHLARCHLRRLKQEKQEAMDQDMILQNTAATAIVSLTQFNTFLCLLFSSSRWTFFCAFSNRASVDIKLLYSISQWVTPISKSKPAREATLPDAIRKGWNKSQQQPSLWVKLRVATYIYITFI